MAGNGDQTPAPDPEEDALVRFYREADEAASDAEEEAWAAVNGRPIPPPVYDSEVEPRCSVDWFQAIIDALPKGT